MLEDYKVEFADTVFECVDKGFKKNEPIDVIIRPEDLKIRDKDDKKTILTATVVSSVFKGDHYQVTLMAGENTTPRRMRKARKSGCTSSLSTCT